MAEMRRMWPGVTESALDMEKILKEHGPVKKRKKRGGGE